MGEDPLDNMRFRAAQCRRLADSATNRELREFLLNSAEQIEVDIARLQAERNGRSSSTSE